MIDRLETTPENPVVSIFMFVRNGAVSIRRAIDSVLAQTYPNIEFIVQDGASTDGTLEILASYGEKLKVLSQPDSGPSEGLWRALNRCTGEFIGSCLADEELLPDAVAQAVAIFRREPDVGVVTGDAMITDLAGKQTGLWTSGPFNLVDYLLGDYCPYFCSSFFRRRALLDAGLTSGRWNLDCIEFELWCRLAEHSHIKYVPGVIAKYAAHPGQSSNKAGDVVVHMKGRLNHIAWMCSADGFMGSAPLLRTLFMWGHARRFCEHAVLFERPALAEAVYDLVKQTLATHPAVRLDGIEYDENYGRRQAASRTSARIFARIPGFLRRLIGPSGMTALQARLSSALYAGRGWHQSALRFPPPPDERLKGRMYAQLALRYEARNRPREALKIWQDAAAINGLLDRTDLAGGDRPAVGYTHVEGR